MEDFWLAGDNEIRRKSNFPSAVCSHAVFAASAYRAFVGNQIHNFTYCRFH